MNEQTERFPGDDPTPIDQGGSSMMRIIVIVALVLVVFAGCCGGCVWGAWGLVNMGMEVSLKNQIEGTTAIEEHIGTIDDISFAWNETIAQASVAGQEERVACTISGDKGTGLLIIEQGGSGIENPEWIILEMDGKSFTVLGDPPADLGAGTPSSEESGDDSNGDGGSDADS